MAPQSTQLRLWPERPCRKCGEVKPLDQFYDSHHCCKRCRIAYSKAYVQANREHTAAYKRAYQVAHRAERRVWEQDYHAAHQAAILAKTKAWKDAHPGARGLHAKNQRLKRRGAGPGVTLAEWRAILDCYGHRCLACGATQDLHRDHVVPIALGGAHAAYNIQPLCRRCNRAKGVRIIDYR